MPAAQQITQSERVFLFGPFELAPRQGELRRNCRRVHLQNQPLRLLAALLENAGRIVTREELCRELWPADTFVDFEMGLNTAVRKLRQALGDSAERPRYIETVARRGYRFIAPVTMADAMSVPPPRPLIAVPVVTPAENQPASLPPPEPTGELPVEASQESRPAVARTEAAPTFAASAGEPSGIAIPETAPSSSAPLPSKRGTRARRLRRWPVTAVKATGALLLLALLLVALLLVSLFTVWHS